MTQSMKIPAHIAIIMDGNGRWATSRNKPRYEGHLAGVEALRRTIKAASAWGVKVVTFYTFSTENWNRPTEEVDALMQLLDFYLIKELDSLVKDGVRFETIGDMSRLAEPIQQNIIHLKEATAHNDKITMVIALNYSARQELTYVNQCIAQEVAQGSLKPEEINESTIQKHLYTATLPEPDLLIRTGGEQRISNFLLWQICYTELYFTDIYWPDFDDQEFKRAIEEYNHRERRFGKTSQQIAEEQSPA